MLGRLGLSVVDAEVLKPVEDCGTDDDVTDDDSKFEDVNARAVVDAAEEEDGVEETKLGTREDCVLD